MVIVTIDGNIGSGKTSVLTHLHKQHKQLIDLEPVEKWQPYLTKMYEQDTGYFEFQKQVWMDRSMIQDNSTHLIFMERSPECTRNTFIEILRQPLKVDKNNEIGSKLTQDEYNKLQIMYDEGYQMFRPSKYIYIQTPPEICFERIKERGRQSENNISYEYIVKLHEYHEYFFTSMKQKGVDITIIDGDKKIEDICKIILSSI